MKVKNRHKYLLVIILIFVFSGLHAQICTGRIFGLNFSALTLKTMGATYDPKSVMGIHFGGFFEIPLRSNLAFQTKILFSAKGSDYETDSADFSLSPIYLEIPVLAVYRFGKDALKVSLFAGPYFACGIGGYKIVPDGELIDLSFGSGENCDMKTFDAGLNFGAGVTIHGMMISAHYSLGLSDIAPSETADSEMKNSVIGFSLSSYFAKRQ